MALLYTVPVQNRYFPCYACNGLLNCLSYIIMDHVHKTQAFTTFTQLGQADTQPYSRSCSKGNESLVKGGLQREVAISFPGAVTH